MLVKVNYFGFYPLGSDIKINNIEIMKSEWYVYKKYPIIYGKKHIVSPFLQELFYVVSKTDIVFFCAVEWGLGHYHIFTVSERQSKKLSKSIDTQNTIYHPIAIHINKVGHSVRIFGRVVSGERDMNFKVADSIFKLIRTEVSEELIKYTFTNNGDDRFYLDVYNPRMVDDSELFILIGEADKIIWYWDSTEMGEVRQEYRWLDTYGEFTRCCSGEKEILYFH